MVQLIQKVLHGYDVLGRRHFIGKYINHRLVARPEPGNTFWTSVFKFNIIETARNQFEKVVICKTKYELRAVVYIRSSPLCAFGNFARKWSLFDFLIIINFLKQSPLYNLKFHYLGIFQSLKWVAVISARKHKRQRRKRQSVTAKTRKVANVKVLSRNTNLT